MTITLYGSDKSRTRRVFWTLEELGVDYVHDSIGYDDPKLKTPHYLRLNPLGAIPILADGDVLLSESLAINLYLAKTYGSGGERPLYPSDPAEEAQAWRWSLWVQAHLEPWIQKDVRTRFLRTLAGPELADLVAVELTKLDGVLQDRTWMLGDRFTVADLNVAGVLSPSRTTQMDLSPHPNVAAWVERCYARPAAQAVRQRWG
ncbi:MAG TPA: glutathione S-transferase family protein [Caulobacteraceae bacterium]|jgi:glutathione S-transferase|nr:glutathione S-transferase family protein [Caulobacteraceae bacterium]